MEEVKLGEIIVDEEIELGEIIVDVIKVYPELENLVITPSNEEQKFKASKYGYDEITVNPIPIKITNAQYLFYGGARADYMDILLALCEKVTNTTSMFNGCTSLTTLDLSNFDTSLVYAMSGMFQGCSNLTELNIGNFNTRYVANMGSMFNGCKKLTSLDVSSFDTSNVTGIAQIFNGCSGLTDLDLSNWDMSKVNSAITAFNGCTNLTNFKAPKNLGKAFTQKSNNYTPYQLSFSSCTKLTHESLMDIINNLYDLNLVHNTANGGLLFTQKLTLGATNLAKLTAEEIRNCYC